MENHEQDYVDEKKLSKVVSIPLPTLRNWRHRGQGPPYKKIGVKMVRYSLIEVREWMEAHTVLPIE